MLGLYGNKSGKQINIIWSPAAAEEADAMSTTFAEPFQGVYARTANTVDEPTEFKKKQALIEFQHKLRRIIQASPRPGPTQQCPQFCEAAEFHQGQSAPMSSRLVRQRRPLQKISTLYYL
eukprot:2774349-Amphidinium_carterae.1